MWFKLFMLVHLCTAFPLKCPEQAQWAMRAYGHCTDPSKYFCLKNDLINGYSENCTISDFQQSGRKAVLRGGIDADICSVERYQPFQMTFFTNASTNCIILKSFCNEEGQVVYDHGNRNTDTTCRCDYRRGYDFIVKPKNPCFCRPSKEDCSCFLKTCSNIGHIISLDYNCIHQTDSNLVKQCQPITDGENVSSNRSEITVTTPMKLHGLFLVKWKDLAAIIVLSIVFLYGTVIVSLVFFGTSIERLLQRICCIALEIKSPQHELYSIEGETLTLKYQIRPERLVLHFFKDNKFIAQLENITKEHNGMFHVLTIMNIKLKDEGLYYAEVNRIRSDTSKLTVQPMFTSAFEPVNCIEGDMLQLECTVYSNNIDVHWFKGDMEIEENENTCIEWDDKKHLITFKHAKLSDSGQYCVVAGKVQKQLKVTVQAFFKRPLNNITIMEGLDARFECEVAKPYPGVWYRDGQKVSSSTNIQIDTHQERVHMLTIYQTTLEQKGKYEIKINNIYSKADLDIKEMPDAIKQMSVPDRRIFLEAAKQGTTPRYNMRIILVGKQGGGKTSLLRRLMNEGIEDVKSTDGLDIKVNKCKINVHTTEWIFTKGNEYESREYPHDQFADCGFWDFAGQKEFYATHQTFLSMSAIYLLVVDLSEDFERKTFTKMIEDKFDNTGDYIAFWMDNIHCYTTLNETDESSTLTNDLLNPPVIIVGTCMDNVQDTGQTIDRFEIYIKTLLGEHPKWKHLRKCFFLSNTEPLKYKKEFQSLRNDICERAKEITKWGDNLPTRWILLEKEIDRLIDNKEFVISYDIARGLASKCSFSLEEVTLELDSFLKYEHEIGNLIFFEDIKCYIILELKWLVGVFRCFVAPFQFQSEFVNIHEWYYLQTTGHLSKALIQKLFKKVQLLNSNQHGVSALEEIERNNKFALKIMEKFDILVKPMTTNNNEEYYMPCMMEASRFDQILDTFNVRNINCTRTSWFGLEFIFLPPAFFNHILVSFLKKYSLCIVGERRLAIYRGIGVFDLKARLKLVVCLSENSVSMQVWKFKTEEGTCYHENRKFLTKIVDNLQQKYKMNIPYRCFFKCPDGTHHKIAERIYLNKGPRTAPNCCSTHIFHTRDELRRFWFEGPEDVIDDQQFDNAVKCHCCMKMAVFRCYECSEVLCEEDCSRKHDELMETKHHSFQSTSDKMLLNDKCEVSDDIVVVKALPDGLLVFAVYGTEMLLTYSVIDKQRNKISVNGGPLGIAILDRNTIVVLLSKTVASIAIVDIRQRQVIQHVDVTLDLSSCKVCPMFYINDRLYISSLSGITVMTISGETERKIDLGFIPRDMCCDTKAARIYCIDRSEKKLICTDIDGNTIFTFTDPSLIDSQRLTLDKDGYVLILCHGKYNFRYFKALKISLDGKSVEVIIITWRHNTSRVQSIDIWKPENDFSSICFDGESDEVFIGIEKTIYIYKTN